MRQRGDTSRFGYPPLLPPRHVPEPWDYPLMELSGLWFEGRCRCGRRYYPLRLMAADLGWYRTLRQLLPRLVCKTCGERLGKPRLLANPAAGAPGHPGGDTWSIELE